MRTPIKTILLVVAAALAVTTTAHARSWRVNSDASKKAHFLDLNAACASEEVQAGDTLYLDPGCDLSSTQNITKQVMIIGTGFFLDTSVHHQATIKAPVNLRAAGIKLEGICIARLNRLSICADDVTVERCYIWDVFWDGTGRNATFRQCYVTGRIVGNGINNTTSSGCIIENCIICYDWTSGSYSDISDMMNATIRNNYVRNVMQNTTNLINNMGNSTIVNNIFIQARDKNKIRGTLTNCIFARNIMSCAEGTYTDYTDNISLGTNDESSVFALEGTNDQRYQLKEDSPAKGAAADGGDCGPFGGMYPYVPSGRPLGIPYIESTNRPTRAVDGQVKVSQTVKIQTK